jgi:sugar phosphate permease
MVWKFRYTTLVIIFVAWVVAYMDRMVMSVAIPYIAKDFNLTPVTMGIVMSAFFAGYALCQIPGGMLADKFGAQRLMVVALSWWSAFTAITGTVGSLTSMLIVRVLFGIGEGVFPGGYFKYLAKWFPVKERTTANSIGIASNLFGSAVAPLFVVAIMSQFGWRAVFYCLFIPGIIMAILIWVYVKETPDQSSRVSSQEREEAKGNEPVVQALGGKKVTLGNMIKLPILWKCFFIWFCHGIIWWGFVAWLPSYLVQVRGFSMVKMGITASLPFFAGTGGMVLGGYISDKFFSRNRVVVAVIPVLLAAFFVYMTYSVGSAAMAVVYQTCFGFVYSIFGGAFWGIPMNVVPKEVMGASASTINFGATAAGFVSPIVMGYLVQVSGGKYDAAFLFIIAALVAAALVLLTIRQKAITPEVLQPSSTT